MFSFKDWLLIEESHKFSCVLANLPNKDAKKVLDWSKQIKEEDIYEAEGREDEPHITVLYGLHTQSPKDVEKIVKDEMLKATLGIISKFSTHPDYDVLKIEVDSKSFTTLNKKLKKLPFTSSHPGYKPHCTLAYVKKGRCNNLVGDKVFNGMKITFDDIIFSNSDGKKTKISL